MQYLAALSLLMGVTVSLMSGEMKIKLFHRGVIKMDSLRLKNINAALKNASPEERKQIKKMRAFHLIALFFLYSGVIIFCVWLYGVLVR